MNLLITGAWPDAKVHIPELEAMGHSVAFLQQERDELPCDPAWVEGVIGNGLFLYHSMEEFPNLRFIQLTSAGYDRVDMDYVRRHNIEIYNAKGVYSVPMAEFAVAGVLQFYKQSRFFFENQRAHRWEKHRGLMELWGKTVVIVGCGSVGIECAKRFKAFDCHIVGVNRTVRDDLPYFDQVVGLGELDTQLRSADVVVVAIALTEDTRGLVDSGLMRPDAVLVNLSRGATVSWRGNCSAVLDVFEQEPLEENDPLWDAENVMITPHNSFVGDNNGWRLWDVIRKNLEV